MSQEHAGLKNLLALFGPDPEALLNLLRPRIDDSMLQEIAEADYEIGAEGHLTQLRRVRDEGWVVVPWTFEPGEVLALSRWIEPDVEVWRGQRLPVEGHLIRAFACAAILRARNEPVNDDFLYGDDNDTIAQLLISALRLGTEVQAATSRVRAWRLERMPADDQRPFYALALLLLAAFLGRERFRESTLERLSDWILADEAAVRRERRLDSTEGRWLLDLATHDLCHEVWMALAARLDREAAKLEAPNVQQKLQEIARRLQDAPDPSAPS